MINLKQDLLAVLQKHYFPQADLSDMIHGISEEVGEMNHWYLKSKQGILPQGKARLEMADAFGDMVIYGIQAMTFLNFDAERVIQQTIDTVSTRNWGKRKYEKK